MIESRGLHRTQAITHTGDMRLHQLIVVRVVYETQLQNARFKIPYSTIAITILRQMWINFGAKKPFFDGSLHCREGCVGLRFIRQARQERKQQRVTARMTWWEFRDIPHNRTLHHRWPQLNAALTRESSAILYSSNMLLSLSCKWIENTETDTHIRKYDGVAASIQ